MIPSVTPYDVASPPHEPATQASQHEPVHARQSKPCGDRGSPQLESNLNPREVLPGGFSSRSGRTATCCPGSVPLHESESHPLNEMACSAIGLEQGSAVGSKRCPGRVGPAELGRPPETRFAQLPPQRVVPEYFFHCLSDRIHASRIEVVRSIAAHLGHRRDAGRKHRAPTAHRL